jgi:hypothetical protein
MFVRPLIDSVSTLEDYGLDGRGLDSRQGQEIFCSDPLWSPAKFLLNGYRGLLLQE